MADNVTDVDIDAWAEEAKREIDRFVATWRQDAESQPDMFPLVMPLGEWDEQYRSATGG